MSKFNGVYLTKDHNFQRWFPPHMNRGLLKMRSTMKKVDCVIEVHDARIPFSGRNPELTTLLSSKPRVIVLNKADLVSLTEHQVRYIHQHYQEEGIRKLLFTKCAGKEPGVGWNPVHTSISKVIPACIDLVQNSLRYNRMCDNDISIMVVGVPNVGKSSLMNDIRRHYLGLKPSCGVASHPGYTKTVSTKTKVCDNPTVYLCDTPGIFSAKIQDMEEGMKLAVCNTVHDHLMGSPMVAEYLLMQLNENSQHSYVKRYKLRRPTDCIQTILGKIAKAKGFFCSQTMMTGTGKVTAKTPDYESAGTYFLNAFREGRLGKFTLDKL